MTVDADAERQNEVNVIAARWYADVCIEAERIIETTGRVEGAHYAAMRRLLERGGVLVYAESILAQKRKGQP